MDSRRRPDVHSAVISKKETGDTRTRPLASARPTAWRATRPIWRVSPSTTQIQVRVSSSSKASRSVPVRSALVDIVLAVDGIERPLVLQDGTPHRAEQAGALGGVVGHELRHRPAMLRDDELLAGLADAVHQLQTGRLERRRGNADPRNRAALAVLDLRDRGAFSRHEIG